MTYTDYFNDYRNEANAEAEGVYQKISLQLVRARKNHTCTLCKKTIEAGTDYYRHAYLDEGLFRVAKQHDAQGYCAMDDDDDQPDCDPANW